MALAHRTARETAHDHEVYGFTTGVGALRDVDVAGDLQEHRCGCCAATPLGSATQWRRRSCGDDVVRLAQGRRRRRQPPAGGRRADRGPVRGPLPRLRGLGGIGTGDLTVLAQLALALAGEPDPRDPAELPHRLDIQPGDALPFMSSNAATFATRRRLGRPRGPARRRGRRGRVTFEALRGNPRRSTSRRRRPAAGRAHHGGGEDARADRRRAAGRPAAGPVRAALRAAGRRRARRRAGRASRTCSRSRSTRARRTRCSPAAGRSTTAASTPRPARSRSTPCGWRSCRSPACRPLGSRT